MKATGVAGKGRAMPPEMFELHGNLRVEVFDHLGGRLLGRAMLLIEPAPADGQVERARLEPDPQLRLESGSHYLRMPTGEGWQVELQRDPSGAFAVVAPSTPLVAPVGGE